MAIKLIPQDIDTLRLAYEQRKREYDVLRSAGEWSGAVLHAGILLELALKIAICKQLDVTRLPRTFQVHDLEFLLYCSGHYKKFKGNPVLYRNFSIVQTHWSTELRYEGAVITQTISDEVHQALLNSTNGILAFLLTS